MVTHQRIPSPATRWRSHPSRRQFLGLTGAAGAGLLGLNACGSAPFDTEEQLTFMSWGTGVEGDAVNAVLTEFARSAGLEPNPQPTPAGDYATRLNTLIAANTPPDAGYITEPMAMRLATQGRLVNVLDQPAFNEFMPLAIHYYEQGKAIHGNGLETMAVWYDADVLSEAGVEAPATAEDVWDWETYVEIADLLTVDGEGRHPSDTGFDADDVVRYGTTSPYPIRQLIGLLKSNGLDLFDSDGTRTYIDDPAAIEVLQALNDLIFEHRVAPNSAQTEQIGGSALQLASKRVATTIDGQWLLPDFNLMRQDEDLSYGAAVIPSFGQGAWCVSMAGGIGAFQNASNREAAVDLLVALADPASCNLYEIGLWMPSQEKYYTDPELAASWIDNDAHPPGYRTAVADMVIENATSFPSFRYKNWDQIEQAFAGALTPLFTEKVDMAAAAQSLAEQVNPLMQGRYIDTDTDE